MLFSSKFFDLKHFSNVLLSVIVLILVTSNCAKKGRPNGGKKDSLAPLMVTANPPYKTLNFDKKKITIYFDEYITLKDVNQQLIVSPPLKFPLTITPQGTPSKYISIKITDTLQAKTTYTFNFGNSIQDNNEGNKLEAFKYIFSTGSYIDSLKTSGKIKDAFNKETTKNSVVLLYKIDSTYNDSIIYKQKPNYVASTLDSTVFQLSNLEKGNYLVIALQDASSNYLFNPKEDKIGFLNTPISLPKDSIIPNAISIFKEEIPFRLVSPKEIHKGHILFGFEGVSDGFNIEALSETSNNFKSFFKFESQKDSVNYWFSNYEQDSIIFKITTQKSTDTTTVFLRKKVVDSLKVNSNTNNVLDLKNTFTLTSNNPITKVDTSQIKLFNTKDSISVKYKYVLEKTTNKLQFLFTKKPETSYKLQLFPKALTDVFNTQNDSLKYLFITKTIEDYGSIELNVKGSRFPAIIELISEKNSVIERTIINKPAALSFDLLPPGNYHIRAIIDRNSNQKWDTGNFLQKTQAEQVIYHPTTFTIRANWLVPETLILR